MHAATMVAQGVTMMALPAVALALVRRRTGVPIGPALAGAAAFVGSQVVHLPLNAGVAALCPPLPEGVGRWLVPLALGASAGVCEETARWVSLRRNRTSAGALATGIGHGGVEAALLGLAVVVTVVRLMGVGDGEGLPEEARQQVAQVWAASDLVALVAIAERVFAMTAHAAASLLVGLAVVRRSVWPWLGAFLLHAALDAGAVALAPAGAVVTEGFVGGVALACVGVIVLVTRAWPVDAPPAAPPVPPPASAGSLSRRPLSASDALHDDLG
ncbi:MAG: YhfC family intramembrane metalloprotease [Alphaproteobacteria bacterium]|nr:YhfC family intramembrane metalloprotease [Alphaproteobacteria bacterium]